MRSGVSQQDEVNVSEQQQNIERAMEKEVSVFKQREQLLEVFRVNGGLSSLPPFSKSFQNIK